MSSPTNSSKQKINNSLPPHINTRGSSQEKNPKKPIYFPSSETTNYSAMSDASSDTCLIGAANRRFGAMSDASSDTMSNYYSLSRISSSIPTASTDCAQKPQQLQELGQLVKKLSVLAENFLYNGQTLSNIQQTVTNAINQFSNIYRALPSNEGIPNLSKAIQSLFEITDRLLFIILHVYSRNDFTEQNYISLINSLNQLNELLQPITNRSKEEQNNPTTIFSHATSNLKDCYFNEHKKLLINIEQMLIPSQEDTLEDYYTHINQINELSFYSNHSISYNYGGRVSYVQHIQENLFDGILKPYGIIDLDLNNSYTSILKHTRFLNLATNMLSHYEKIGNDTEKNQLPFIKNMISLLNKLDKNVCKMLGIKGSTPLKENQTYTKAELQLFLNTISTGIQRIWLNAMDRISTTRKSINKIVAIDKALYELTTKKEDNIENLIQKTTFSINNFIKHYNIISKNIKFHDYQFINKYLFQITNSLLFIIVDIDYSSLRQKNYKLLTSVLKQLVKSFYIIPPHIDQNFTTSISYTDLEFFYVSTALITFFTNQEYKEKFNDIINRNKSTLLEDYYTKLQVMQELNLAILNSHINVDRVITPKGANYSAFTNNKTIFAVIDNTIITFVYKNFDFFTTLDCSNILSLAIHKKLLQLLNTVINKNWYNDDSDRQELHMFTIKIINALDGNLSKILNEKSYAFNQYEIYTQDEIKTIFNRIKEKSERVLNPTMSNTTDNTNKEENDPNTNNYGMKNTYVDKLGMRFSFLIRENAIENIINQIININTLVEEGKIADNDSFCRFLHSKSDHDGYQYRRVALCILLVLLKRIDPVSNKYSELIPLYNNKNIELMKKITVTQDPGNDKQLTITIPQKRLLGKKIPKHNSFTIGGERSPNHAAITPSSNTAGNRGIITTTLTTGQVTGLGKKDLYDGDFYDGDL